MVWIVAGGLMVLVILGLLVIARRKTENGHDADLGSISSGWLSENRAHERDSSHTR